MAEAVPQKKVKALEGKPDINITPLVDVMLVLLIVFMVAAPMLEQGVEINLPQAAAQVIEQPEDKKILVKLAVDRDQRIILSFADKDAPKDTTNGKVIPPGEFLDEMKRLAANPGTVTVNVSGDASVRYGFLAKVMAQVRQAGIKNVNLLTQPSEDE